MTPGTSGGQLKEQPLLQNVILGLLPGGVKKAAALVLVVPVLPGRRACLSLLSKGVAQAI